MILSKWQRWGVVCVLYITLALLAPQIGGFDYDALCFKTWAAHIFNKGLQNAYTEWNNYMPVFQYVLYIYNKLQGSEEAILRNIYQLKILTLLFDFAGLWYIYRWIDKKTDFMVLVLCNMLNVAYAYNTIFWGQVDGMFTTMVFVSLYYAYQNKTIISLLLFVLALNVKLQAIVFFPVLGLLYLYHMVREGRFVQPAIGIAAAALLQAVLLWPFLTISNGFGLFWKEVMAATELYSFVSMNAYNLWYFVIPPDNVMTTPDTTIVFAGLPYMRVGLLLFCAGSFAAMFPLLKNVYSVFLKRDETTLIAKDRLWLVCALVALLFFYCNTQMHERYSHPAFIFITAYAFYSRSFAAYILFSIGYLLNLEAVNKWLKLENYSTFIFDGRVGAVLFGACIVLLFVKLYRKTPKISIT